MLKHYSRSSCFGARRAVNNRLAVFRLVESTKVRHVEYRIRPKLAKVTPMVQTLSRHSLDIVWLIYEVCCHFSCGWIQYLSETVHTLSGRCPCTVQTLSRWTELGKKCVYKNFCFKYFPDTFQTLSAYCPYTVWTLSWYWLDTVQTLSKHSLTYF